MSARMLYIWSSVLVSRNLYVVGFPAFKRVEWVFFLEMH